MDFNDLELVLQRLDETEPEDLKWELVRTYRRLLHRERTIDAVRETGRLTANRADLYGRRCQLALEICRDDEKALSVTQLDQLAEIIWPISPTDKPTDKVSESDYLSMIVRAAYLLDLVRNINHTLIDTSHAAGLTLGPGVEESYKRFLDLAAVWKNQASKITGDISEPTKL